MNAMILAAGYGKRLAPITDNTPKPLITVGGKTMLEHVLTRLKSAGVSKVAINVHHLADQILDFLRLNDNFGIDIRISDESAALLDTGGGLAKALPLIADDCVILYNVDIISDFPIEDMMSMHNRNSADITLLTSDRSSSRKLLFSDNIMKGWINEKTGEIKTVFSDIQDCEHLAFGGVHILTPKALMELKRYAQQLDSTPFSIIDFYINCCDRLKIMSYTPDRPYSWFDIGRPETLQAARAYYDLKQE